MGGKTCNKCKSLKPIDCFHRNRHRPDGRVNTCKKCANNTPAKQQYVASGRRKENDRRQHLKRFYGLTEQAFEALLAGQGGVCAICRRKPQRPLQVDHDHDTGNVRGLLCGHCNTAIAFLQEDVGRLDAVRRYLGD